ncbi:LCM-domain-containing protein [Penicillium chermesinum]|uniref:tRNA wybutosine-synthesizing protein 4 n=1 Tax=Penicillium chermesinum TaxID=63820 RepID=A0A9W9TWD1_9EURO|nr:LCM-domain-containing protein [Penicillium chermesinum]KAJ5246246.1 LCM-domain-containing protein [Penicillium chermesinum]
MAPASRHDVAMASKAEKDADVVMGTNNSSIASKRSVEMIYYPRPHFFRYFVKKPQRRSPIINRGYWLRMYAMEETVRQFIAKAPTDKAKFVLNLGCGYDPLPFILLSDEQKSAKSSHTVFVDIDYEKLMIHKKSAIREAQEIKDVIGDAKFGSDEDPIQICSSRYLGVGCDLKNLKKLNEVLLGSILPSQECSVLFLAEVSLTYMDVHSANEVVKWAAQLTDDVQFCILEQFFPDGPQHPFAKTMMTHFHKLRAPLFSIHEFPSLTEQEQRFQKAGWAQAQARSLWDLWSDDEFLPESVRTGLDSFEVFDEWEEFALFASHYFVLIATNTISSTESSNAETIVSDEFTVPDVSSQFSLQAYCPPGRVGRRRYGSLVPGSQDFFGHHGGQGEQSRLATTDQYSCSETPDDTQKLPLSRDIPARMCHTITALDVKTSKSLLVGGRASPAAPMADCWLRKGDTWQQVHPLPEPRFRHSSVKVSLGNGQGSILVYGGKSKGNVILDSWLYWNGNGEQGWQGVEVIGPRLPARFGAGFAAIDDNCGVVFGGIGSTGTILEDFWSWSLCRRRDGSLQVDLVDRTAELRAASPRLFSYLTRFGATIDATSHGLIVAGGIIPRRLVPGEKEILLLDSSELVGSSKPYSSTIISAIGLGGALAGARPLLTGHASQTRNSDQVLFVGGGATCFSFGTFWTEGTWLLQSRDSKEENRWAIVAPRAAPSKPIPRGPGKGAPTEAKETVKIPRARITSEAQFQQIVANGKPVVLEGSDIGPCTEKWTKEYLTMTVGEERKIIVHQAQSERMNFQSKNFAYVTKDFATFLDEVHAGGRQYLRSISADQPSRLPATLATDFPTLQDDFQLPEYMNLVTKNAHSSPLRISGPVTMWLHYDVMANVLCQVRGERRLVLFPPDDVQSLHIPAGASSSTIDIFEGVGLDAAASIPGTSPHEAILRPGEILFIPPLWLHTACSATSEVSVAVNVFFRNLTQGQDLQRMVRSFEGVPPDMARFYLRRLAQELQELADQ